MKKLLSLILILNIIFACGCTAGYMDKTEGDVIPPVQDSTVSATSAVMPLYFRYYNEPMLIRYSVAIEITNHEQPEFYAINALLSKPLGERTEFTYLFKGKTKLISVKSDGNHLYVTLSNDFYNDTLASSQEETFLNRSLAIYSIVNTVCEMGTYQYVQIYIEQNGAQLRPDAYTVGLQKSQADSAPLGPLSRNTALLLTPSSVAKTALNYFSKTQWDKLYLYLGEGTTKLPILEEITQNFNYLDLKMSDFTVEDNYTVAEDGKTAFVQVSFKIRRENASYEVANVPLMLVLKGRTWLVSYDSLIKLLGVTK